VSNSGFLKKLNPNSLARLVLVGFLLAGLPLILAVGSAVYSVDELADLSQKAVYRAVRMTQGSRMLMENLTDMERSLRQYQVLDDADFLNAFQDQRELFLKTSKQLLALKIEGESRENLAELAALEKTLFEVIEPVKKEGKQQVVMRIDNFSVMNEIARELWLSSSELVNQEVSQLNKASTEVQKRILTHSAFLLPASVLLVLFFTYWIARPIRQLDGSIKKMGKGDFSSEISITGPQDLEYLGQRLDWLRLRLRKLEQDNQKFLQHVSHDLKTPLASINEGSGLLVDEVVGELNGEQAEIVKIIQSSSAHLNNLIEDILNYSHLNSQKSSLNIEHIELEELINGMIKRYKIQFKSKEISLKKELESIVFFADREKLKVIIDNLLSNAVKYSPRSGQIVLSSQRQEDSALIEISDQGPGIAEEEQSRVFDLFFKGRSRGDVQVQGSGVGLAIAKDYVEAHGGSLKVDANYKNGARFVLLLPLEPR